MKRAPSQSGVEGLPLFEVRPQIQRFAPVSDVREDLGYGPSPKRARQDVLTADDKRDEDLSFRSLADTEDLILGLPENQRPATDEEIANILGLLKESLVDSTSHPR